MFHNCIFDQETGSSSRSRSTITVQRKESVKRRAECTSSGTYAKRRAVHESPDTPTTSKKGKGKSSLFRRKAKKSKMFIKADIPRLAESTTDFTSQG